MRYYVTIQSGDEKGPYEENEVRAWLAAGTMPRTAPTRAENEATTRPAWEVFPGVAPSLQIAANEIALVEDNPLPVGSFWLGFLFAGFCQIIALLYLLFGTAIASETRRGIKMGLIIQFVIFPLIGLFFWSLKIIATGEP
ncbi:hypothetical protein [Polyangium sp. 6x1]|uniref:hypothetical protein n=1 Tax=Polyangium sp. 6x1 TaxID=3042689 RepID=UPI0024827603|nr:hypothetical protein [Polyangium sp. 6x1]MDI1442656.1 hypothetical protein [Polyangium sp. 6x1]